MSHFNVIPVIQKPVMGRLYVQRHDAGHLHHDVSLVGPDGVELFRGAVTKSQLDRLFPTSRPTAFVRQPQHSSGKHGYDFTGEIKEGYGKGWQEVVLSEPIELLRAKPGEIVFNLYKSPGNQAIHGGFALIDCGSQWLCVRTKNQPAVCKFKNEFAAVSNRKPGRQLPDDALKAEAKLKAQNIPYIVEAKLDGAANLMRFGAKSNQIWSYREGKRSKDIWLHDKFPELRDDVHPEFDGTVARGELLWIDSQPPKGAVMTAVGRERANIIAKLSNIADPFRSRKESRGGSVIFMIYDIKKVNGKSTEVTNISYQEKRELAQMLSQTYDRVYVPPAYDDLQAAWNDVVGRRGGEGVIIKRLDAAAPDLDNPEAPKWIKVKAVDHHDLRVLDKTSLARKDGRVDDSRIGALICRTEDGHKVEVGGGFSDFQRRWLAQNFDEIIADDAVIRVKAHHVTNNGSLHGPIFQSVHEGKSSGRILEMDLCDSADSLDVSPYALKSAAGWKK